MDITNLVTINEINVDLNLIKNSNEILCDNCKNIIKTEKINDKNLKLKNKYEKLYDLYTNGNFKSIRDFAKTVDVSHVSITKGWKKYIPEYNNCIQGKSFKIDN